jgi:hypothetical protein
MIKLLLPIAPESGSGFFIGMIVKMSVAEALNIINIIENNKNMIKDKLLYSVFTIPQSSLIPVVSVGDEKYDLSERLLNSEIIDGLKDSLIDSLETTPARETCIRVTSKEVFFCVENLGACKEKFEFSIGLSQEKLFNIILKNKLK